MKKLHIGLFIVLSYLSFSQTVSLETFGPIFSSPVEIAHAGDDRLFIVEQGGVIKILNADGSANPTPFLDIDNLVSSGGERGLLGLAFAPDYSSSGRFYVNYTNNSGNTVISRYTVSSNPDVANTSATILLTITQPYSNHNGGKITFGPDGYLYIATGDGGSAGDPGNRSQNTNTLLGKILRIDVDGSTYDIPADNPYANSGGSPEIYAIGLRNPWKLSFDTLNGDLWIADVGQNAFEEIDKVVGSGTPGDNYGWRCYEGNAPYNNDGSCPAFSNTVMPVADYALANGRCSVTGGYLYRGSMYPSFYGKYFFADYCSNEIGILTENSGIWNMTFQTPNITQFWTTFGEDINGELYIAGNGRVYKILDPNLNVPENEGLHFEMYPNPSNNIVNIRFPLQYRNIESVTIYTVRGKTIKKTKPNNTAQLSISTSKIPSGLYLIEVSTGNGEKAIRKLIIN